MRRKTRKQSVKRMEMLRDLAAGWSGSTWVPHGTSRAAEAAEALQRMDSGIYGICVDCDEKLPESSLNAKPDAIRCFICHMAQDKRIGA